MSFSLKYFFVSVAISTQVCSAPLNVLGEMIPEQRGRFRNFGEGGGRTMEVEMIFNQKPVNTHHTKTIFRRN